MPQGTATHSHLTSDAYRTRAHTSRQLVGASFTDHVRITILRRLFLRPPACVLFFFFPALPRVMSRGRRDADLEHLLAPQHEWSFGIPPSAGDVLYRKYRYWTAGAGTGDMERDGDEETLLDGEERGSCPSCPP